MTVFWQVFKHQQVEGEMQRSRSACVLFVLLGHSGGAEQAGTGWGGRRRVGTLSSPSVRSLVNPVPDTGQEQGRICV